MISDGPSLPEVFGQIEAELAGRPTLSRLHELRDRIAGQSLHRQALRQLRELNDPESKDRLTGAVRRCAVRAADLSRDRDMDNTLVKQLGVGGGAALAIGSFVASMSVPPVMLVLPLLGGLAIAASAGRASRSLHRECYVLKDISDSLHAILEQMERDADRNA